MAVIDAIIALVVVLIVLILLLLSPRSKYKICNTVPVRSSVDGQRYKVNKFHSNPDDAANMLAEINANVLSLLRHLKKKYTASDGASPTKLEVIENIRKKYNPDNIVENSPNDPENDTSYTINKGKILAMCIRKKKSDRAGCESCQGIHEMNTLMFVTLHELAHIGTRPERVAHSDLFWGVFKFLVNESVEIGILYPENYGLAHRKYCGIDIDYNPYFDPSVIDI